MIVFMCILISSISYVKCDVCWNTRRSVFDCLFNFLVQTNYVFNLYATSGCFNKLGKRIDSYHWCIKMAYRVMPIYSLNNPLDLVLYIIIQFHKKHDIDSILIPFQGCYYFPIQIKFQFHANNGSCSIQIQSQNYN